MNLSTQQTILLIEDNPGDIRLIEEYLKEITSFQYKLISASSLKEGCSEIEKNNLTIILLDLNLPDSIGKRTFNSVLNLAEDVPVVLITGIQDVEQSLSYIKEGAQDYIIKSDLSARLLEKTIFFAIERKKLYNEIITKKKKIEETMSYFINREEKMIELKKELNALLLKNGQEKKYIW